MAPGHAQTPPPPSAGDLPPEFAQEAQAPPAQGGGKIPPPPTHPPTQAEIPPPPPPPEAPPAGAPPPAVVGTPPMVPSSMHGGDMPPIPVEQTNPVTPQFASDDQYTYDPTGRRDPFKPYKSYRPTTPTAGGGPAKVIDMSDPLQRWDLDRFNVVAIMWEIRHPKAMVKDPDGKIFMIGKNTKIGRNSGQVVAIREGEVVVVETIENEGVQTKEVKILELKK